MFIRILLLLSIIENTHSCHLTIKLKVLGGTIMIIKVKIKSSYGSELIYPVNETGRLFADLTKTKTLTREAISIIKALGYTVEVEQELKTL